MRIRVEKDLAWPQRQVAFDGERRDHSLKLGTGSATLRKCPETSGQHTSKVLRGASYRPLQYRFVARSLPRRMNHQAVASYTRERLRRSARPLKPRNSVDAGSGTLLERWSIAPSAST